MLSAESWLSSRLPCPADGGVQRPPFPPPPFPPPPFPPFPPPPFPPPPFPPPPFPPPPFPPPPFPPFPPPPFPVFGWVTTWPLPRLLNWLSGETGTK